MLHHYRKKIREELKERMTNLPGQVGAPLDSPDEVIHQDKVPAVCVFFTEETVDNRRGAATGDGCKFSRPLKATVLIVTKRQDDQDLIAAEVERRMVAKLEGDLEVNFDGTLFQNPKSGEFEFYAVALNYIISYSTDEGSPDRLSE